MIFVSVGILSTRRLAAPLLTFALMACVEGQGLAPPFSDAGHLGEPDAAGAAAGGPNASIIAEAGAGRAGGGATLLGQSRGGASGATLLAGDPPLAGEPISLAIEEAQISEAAAIVLGDALNLPYVVAPEARGTISFRTAAPLAPNDLLSAFRGALEARGFSLVRVNSVWRIAPAGAGAGATGDTELIPLRYIAPEEIAKALELALPADRIRVVTGPSGNAVVVTGSAEERDLARATVAALDIDALAGNSVMLVGLTHAPADALAAELSAIFGGDASPGVRNDEGPIKAGGLRIVPLVRLSAVMLLARDGATLDRAFAWVRRLDQPRKAEAQRLFVYRVQNRPAASLAEALNALFAGQAVEGETAAPVDFRGEPAPRIVVDAEKNALVISAASRQFDTLVDLIRQLDSAPLQVLVETTILEVTLGDSLRYGVQYAFSVGELFNDRDGVVTLTNTGAQITPQFPGFAFTIGTSLGAEAIIEALDSVTDLTVVSSPKLLVRDGQTATLQIGDQVPIVTQTAEGFDDNARIVNAVEYRDTGVTLRVTPRVNSGGFVSLEVDQEVSSVTATTTSGIDSPTISRRSVTTDVTIRSGQTVVLGGLIQDSSSAGRNGIPVLGEIPVLGAAFGRRNQSAGRTELLALLRPHILASPEQAEDLTSRLRAEFEAIARSSAVRLRTPGRTKLPDFSAANQ
ncbi:type II secretion system secretin GspD [Pikeienuella piscinae]|uniref:Type II secretion system secretin GspD n=1 Tax=Pikeienuella piscinae TaxID=2748098 RepID=A0A7L5BVX6_9RHOB|nr:type II secretion system secretin GspD [Pikeienuella piscinae]QIE55273.1 type II secretion system secretin GspD [Pikeienuella piscinae]